MASPTSKCPKLANTPPTIVASAKADVHNRPLAGLWVAPVLQALVRAEPAPNHKCRAAKKLQLHMGPLGPPPHRGMLWTLLACY